MCLSSSTEYEITATSTPSFFPLFVMPAQAGIQGTEGMDTGFRRYD